MQPLIFAHRGASHLAPENTLAAFSKAKELGADGVEMDVQTTKDGKLVIHHDYMLDLHTKIQANIYDMVEGDLRQLDVGSWMDAAYSGQHIPTLKEALEATSDFDDVMLEMKSAVRHHPDFVKNVVETIKETGMTDKVILIAFQHSLLSEAKQLLPELRVGTLLYGDLTGFFVPPPTIWKDLGLTNGTDDEPEGEQAELIEKLSGEQAAGLALDMAENPDSYGEENSDLVRWVGHKVTMLRASYPNENFFEIIQHIAAQSDPAAFVKGLDFLPEYVSCNYHTAFVRPHVVDELHAIGTQAAFWTVNTKEATTSLMQQNPDAIVTNRPDRIREWLEEL